jgi:hypothetical protein
MKARLNDGLFFWLDLTFGAGIESQEKCPPAPLKGLTAGC